MKTQLSILAGSLIASLATFAAEQPIETISITGSRLPLEQARLAGSVSVLSAQQIQQSGALNISDLLRTFNGVAISQQGPTGTLTQLRLRGAEANHLLVLIDGVEVNNVGSDGAVNFAHISVDTVERIELLRGPQSALWGNGAVAGVLSITTKGPAGTKKAHAKIEVGQHDSSNVSAGFQGQTGDLSYSLSAAHLESDGQNISRQGMETDGYRKTHGNLALNWATTDNSSLDFSFRAVDYRNEFDRTDFVTTGLPADADNYTEGKQYSAQVQWHYAPKQSMWQQSLGLQYNSDESETDGNATSNSRSKGEKQRLFWLNSFDYAPASRATLVLENVQEEFKQRGVVGFSDPNQEQQNDTNSAVIDLIHGLSDQLTFNLSGRYDNNDVFDNATSYRAGLSYQLTQAGRLFASYGKGVKNPSFTERFGFYPSSFKGNPDLQPEQAYTLEVGSQWQLAQDWQLDLTWFDTDLENEINGFVAVPNSNLFTAENVNGSSQRQGAEVALKGKFAGIDLNFNYGYLDATQPDLLGEQQIEIRRPRHTGSVSLNYAFNQNKTNANIQAVYTGSQNDTFFPPYPQPAETLGLRPYTLVNAAITSQLSNHWTLGVRAENLLDQDYEDVVGYVGPGRSVYMSLSTHW